MATTTAANCSASIISPLAGLANEAVAADVRPELIYGRIAVGPVGGIDSTNGSAYTGFAGKVASIHMGGEDSI
jgi:hypothetical protein